jgi:hypothetical protein
MFLKQLYRYNKKIFIAVLIFLVAFVYINYKWGIVAAPVLQYGMYSGPFYLKDTQSIYIVKANGKKINQAALSFTDRDFLQLYPQSYLSQKEINANCYGTIARFMRLVGLSGFMMQDKFTNQIDDIIFGKWYCDHIKQLTKNNVDSISLYRQRFVWADTQLQPVDTPVKLLSLVP